MQTLIKSHKDDSRGLVPHRPCGNSSWYCLTEFVEANIAVIKNLSYINPNTVKTFRIDNAWSHITAEHKNGR